MVRLKDDNVTLYFIDSATGLEVAASPLDWAKYSIIGPVLDAQHDAVTVNTQAQSAYLSALHAMQIDLDAGRPAPPAPTKPLLKVVPDPKLGTGGVVVPQDPQFIPFNPPLPDPVYPVISAPVGIKSTSTNIPPSADAQMLLSVLMGLNTKMDKILAGQAAAAAPKA